METLSIENYKHLIRQFVKQQISADEFEKEYIELFRKFRDSGTRLEYDVEDVVSTLFTDVDCYCGDTDLRDKDDIDEQELLTRAEFALKQLEKH